MATATVSSLHSVLLPQQVAAQQVTVDSTLERFRKDLQAGRYDLVFGWFPRCLSEQMHVSADALPLVHDSRHSRKKTYISSRTFVRSNSAAKNRLQFCDIDARLLASSCEKHRLRLSLSPPR
jgi:cell division inhibitor SulA